MPLWVPNHPKAAPDRMTYRLISWEDPLEDLTLWSRKPEVKEQHAVPSGSNPEQAYHVRRVECLSKRFEQADVVEDTQEIWLCSCPDARYRRWHDTEPEELTQGITCKHVVEHFKAEKAQNDEDQQTLDNPVGK